MLPAEHFIAHGECLLSAVRAVFNLALGAENPINKRTASNALLQMLNTICKRVTQIQPRLTSGSSECSSRTVSEALDIYYNVPGAGFHSHNSPHSAKGSGTQLDHMAGVLSPQVPAAGMQGQLQYQLSDAGGPALYNPDALTTTAGNGVGCDAVPGKQSEGGCLSSVLCRASWSRITLLRVGLFVIATSASCYVMARASSPVSAMLRM